MKSTLKDRIRNEQSSDEKLQKWQSRDESKWRKLYSVVDGIVRYNERIFVPKVDLIRGDILSEAHMSSYYIHPGNTKIYKELQMLYWWSSMKRDI